MKALIHTVFGYSLARYLWYRRWQGMPEPSLMMMEVTREALGVLNERFTLGAYSSVTLDYHQDGKINIRKPQRYTE